jgi:ribose transport system substrate-binding protein
MRCRRHLQAVMDGRMMATVRNPSCLIHGGAIIAGVAVVVSGEKTGVTSGMIPKHIVMDGPIVTKANAPGLIWMEEHFLI